MKTIKILPKVNNIDFAGRIYTNPLFNKGNTIATISVIRNFGGDKDPVVLDFVLFLDKGKEAPAFLKKGAPVVVHAFIRTDKYTNKDGESVTKRQFIVKTIEEAKLENGLLPTVNNIEFAGRVVSEPYVNDKRSCAMFTLIRNFGGDKEPATLEFMLLPKKGEDIPEFIAKGKPVTAKAYFSPAVYTDKEGNEVKKVRLMVKSVEEAQLVERQVKEAEEAAAQNGADADAEFSDDAVSDVEITEE